MTVEHKCTTLAKRKCNSRDPTKILGALNESLPTMLHVVWFLSPKVSIVCENINVCSMYGL